MTKIVTVSKMTCILTGDEMNLNKQKDEILINRW